MREIKAQDITELVSRLCIDACYNLSPDIYNALKDASVPVHAYRYDGQASLAAGAKRQQRG